MAHETPRESSPIRISAFGRVAVHHPDGRAARSVLTQPKRLALLVYLAVAHPGELCRRDTLLGVFWPEREDRRGRDALNNALSHLRRSLGRRAIVSRGTEEVGLAPDRVACDVAEFREQLEAGRLEAALALYEGDLLAGFHLSNARDFERWVDTERSRLRDLAAATARELATRAESANRPGEGVRWATRALSIAALDESALRTLMRLHAREGRRTTAIRAYDDFRARLGTELGIEPDPATSALASRLRAPAATGKEKASPTETDRSRYAPPSERDAPAAGKREHDSEPHARPDHALAPDIEPAAPPEGEPTTPTAAGGPGVSSAPTSWRTRRLRTAGAIAAAGLAIALLALLNAGGDAPVTEPSLVLVADAVAEGGLPRFEQIGRRATDRIRMRLTDVDGIGVLGPGAERRPEDGEPAGPRSLARLSGAGLVVTTTSGPAGDSIAFTASVMETDGGSVVGVASSAGASEDEPDAAIATLADRVAGIIALYHDPVVRQLGISPGGAPTYAAYLAWSTGLALYARLEYQAAVPHFESALALDPTFHSAAVWAAAANAQTRRWTAVDSLIAGLTRVRSRLSPFDRGFLDYIDGWRTGDPGGMHRAAGRTVEARPNSAAALYLLGSTAYETHRLEQAVRVLGRLEAQLATRDWYSWVAGELASAHHLLGRYEAALDVSRAALAHRPGLTPRVQDEVAALAALGRTDELLDRLGDAVALGRADEHGRMRIIGTAASELYVHGHAAAAREVLDRAIGWIEAGPADSTLTDAGLAAVARVHYLAGRLDRAERHYRNLAAAQPTEMDHRGYLAAIAARRGEAAAARRLAASIDRPTQPHLFGHDVYWRARVEALLGERERALELLERAFSEGVRYGYRNIHPDVHFIGLHGWPPFDALMEPRRAYGSPDR